MPECALEIPQSRMACCVPHSVILLFGLIYTVISSADLPPAVTPQEYDICSTESVPPSVHLPRPGDFTNIYVNWPHQPASRFLNSCVAHIETCDYCRIKVNAVKPMFDYPECLQLTGPEEHCSPNCIYFLLFDANYKELQWRRVSNSLAADGFESQSKHLQISACGNHVHLLNITMRLRLTSVEKVQQISEYWFQPLAQHTFMSPYFPSSYALRNEYYGYKIRSFSLNKYIAVTFDDWMLSPYSSIQFEGANVVNRISGNNIRPYIISNGHSMVMNFSTGENRRLGNNYSFLGFKAVARFYDSRQDVPNIETGCDCLFTTSEGGIIHLNAAADGLNRDCIWVIKKVPSFDGVYLKIIRYKTRYEMMDSCDYSLEVRGGLTSTAPQRLNIQPNEHIPNYAVQVSEDGFYVRIKGCYFDDSVVVSYAMYSNDCDNYREHYKCDNGRCIPDHLRCDTYDHCGDSSDEIPSMCGRITSKIRTVSGEYSTSNVSNTNSGSYNYTLSIHVIIPLVVAIVLGIGIMCLLIIFVRRCRRLNNTAFGRRAVNADVHQTRGRRRCWRNRGIQMSVTMSSGDHPPSYDEVIRSTPIGHLNMAFSWSACENAFTQPPSYEEAISPTSGTAQLNDTLITSAANNNNVCHGETSTNLPHYQSAPVLTATLSASLDPNAYLSLSSSSSSEHTSDDCHHLDTSTSSDSSARDEHSLISNQRSSDNFRTSSDLNKGSRESDPEVSSQRKNIAKYGKGTEALDLIFPKVKDEVNLFVSYDNSNRDKIHKGGKCLRVGSGKTHENKSRPGDTDRDCNNRRESEDCDKLRNGTNEGCGHSKNAAGGLRDGQKLDGVNMNQEHHHDMHRVEESRGNRRQEKERFNFYPEQSGADSDDTSHRNGVKSIESGDRFFHSNTDLNICPPRVTYSSWSQNCADVSLDAARERFLDDNEGRLREDKRFGYAGAGDRALVRQSMNQFYDSRGMANKKPYHCLDKLLSESCDNFGGSYKSRKHSNREYEADVSEGNLADSQSCAYSHTTESSRSRKDKPDLVRPSAVLEPVLENSGGEADDKVRLPHDAGICMDSEYSRQTDTRFRSNLSQDMMASNHLFQMPGVTDGRTRSVFESDLTRPSASQKISSETTRDSNAEDSATVRLKSSNSMTSAPGHHYALSGGQRENFQNSLSSRKLEPAHGKQDVQNVCKNNFYPENSKNINTAVDYKYNSPHSSHQRRNSRDCATENGQIPPFGQDEVAQVAMPTVSVTDIQSSPKPTPAPRSRARNRLPVGTSQSEASTSHEPYQQVDSVPYDEPKYQIRFPDTI